MNKVTIIAGPCSVNPNNINQILEIADNPNIAGVRVVGLKSRTALEPTSHAMGMDFDAIMHNIHNPHDMVVLPSVKIGADIATKTGKVVATEIMIPHIQLTNYELANIGRGNLFAWNPATSQLGWPILETAIFSSRNDWIVGLKNPKWLGANLSESEREDAIVHTSMEKQWLGNFSYASNVTNKVVLIQRGVDVPDKGDYRNMPVHMSATRIKKSNPNIAIYFDPSHSFGPKLRHNIVNGTVDAMKLKIDENNYLYSGILIEVGDSTTDTDQHITIEELKLMIELVQQFRDIATDLAVST